MALLREVQLKAEVRYYSRWRLADGTEVEVPMTTEEYAALGQKGAGAPARGELPGDAVWLYAAGGVPVWDTADGRLGLGQFAMKPNGRGMYLGVGGLDVADVAGTKRELLEADQTFTFRGAAYRLQRGELVKV